MKEDVLVGSETMFTNKHCKINILGMVVLFLTFVLVFGANSLIPMGFGDDYIYSFVWEEGQRFYGPLPEAARRIESWQDYFSSLWAHYLSHSGRLVNFIPVFFFLWHGKEYFNIFNAFLVVVMLVEIYWISNRGKVDLDFSPSKLCWILFMLWGLSVGFSDIFLWLTGFCNYIWPSVLLLGFMLPYIRGWYAKNNDINIEKISEYGFFLFILGILAGWTTENTGCWVILLLAAMLWKRHRNGQLIASWEVWGIAGFIAGYILLMAAPGNFVRLSEDAALGIYSTDFVSNVQANWISFFTALAFQMPLWIFLFSGLKKLREVMGKDTADTEIAVVKGFAALSFCSNAVMLLFPEYPLRSSFPSLLYLIIAACIVARLQAELNFSPWREGFKRMIGILSAAYFIFTVCVSFYGWVKYSQYDEALKETVIRFRQEKGEAEEILEINRIDTPYWVYPASGFHSAAASLKEDPEDWKNMAYARYYEINGIRVVPDEKR